MALLSFLYPYFFHSLEPFMIVVLKSGNFNISVISVLTLFSFFIQFEILLVIHVTNDFQLKLGFFVYYVMILWIWFKTSVLADFVFSFFWSLPQLGSWVVPCPGTVEIEIQIPCLVTLKPERELVTVGCSWDF